MREGIGLYRGKREYDGEWVYGYYYKAKYYKTDTELLDYITIPHPEENGRGSDNIIVTPESVGEYTGKTDKKNKKIFENDIVTHFINWLGKRVNGVVRYDNITASWVCDFVLDDKKESAFLADWVNGNGAEIIGNVWDNPEFLEEKK